MMNRPNDIPAHWWELDLDGPVALTLTCSITVAAVLFCLGFLVNGFLGGAAAAPIGFLGGGALAGRLSNDSTMQSWSCFVDRTLGRVGVFVIFYGSPLWIWMAVRHGLGMVIIALGSLSALLWFTIAGTVAIWIAVQHIFLHRAT